MLLGKLQPAGLADVEVASSVTVYSAVLDLSRRKGAEVASYRTAVLGLDEFMADRALCLTAGNSDTFGAMPCLACLAVTCVIVAIAFNASGPAEWKGQEMALWASIIGPICKLFPDLVL